MSTCTTIIPDTPIGEADHSIMHLDAVWLQCTPQYRQVITPLTASLVSLAADFAGQFPRSSALVEARRVVESLENIGTGMRQHLYSQVFPQANEHFGAPGYPLEIRYDSQELPEELRQLDQARPADLWQWYADHYGEGRGAADLWARKAWGLAVAIDLRERPRYRNKDKDGEPVKIRRDGSAVFAYVAHRCSYSPERYSSPSGNTRYTQLVEGFKAFACWLDSSGEAELAVQVQQMVPYIEDILTGWGSVNWGVARHISAARLTPYSTKLQIALNPSLSTQLSTWFGLYLGPETEED